MPAFNKGDWDVFCQQLIGGVEPRTAIKWITARDNGGAEACQHERTREISTVSAGRKVFCVTCNTQVG